jgi:hypothetical protein
MPTRIIRRATLTALVFAALSAPAFAQTTPPAQPGDQGPRMERGDRGHRMDHRRDHGDRADRQHRMHRHMRMRAGFGGMPAMLGVVPLRPGQEFRFSEGRLAFLRAELKITETQSNAWDAFATALRENVAKLTEAYKAPDREAMQKMSPGERLGWYEKAVTARADAVKRAKAAIEPLYAGLSDDQKKLFDRFVPTGGARDDRFAERRERMRERMERRMERRGEQPGQPGQPRQQ